MNDTTKVIGRLRRPWLDSIRGHSSFKNTTVQGNSEILATPTRPLPPSFTLRPHVMGRAISLTPRFIRPLLDSSRTMPHTSHDLIAVCILCTIRHRWNELLETP